MQDEAIVQQVDEDLLPILPIKGPSWGEVLELVCGTKSLKSYRCRGKFRWFIHRNLCRYFDWQPKAIPGITKAEFGDLWRDLPLHVLPVVELSRYVDKPAGFFVFIKGCPGETT